MIGRTLTRTAAAITCLAALALASCSNPEGTEGLEKVRFAYGVKAIGPEAAPATSVPKEAGFWESEGLDVEIESLDTGPAFQLLAEGEVDFLDAGSGSGIPLVAQGADIIGVAAIYESNIFYPAVLPDSDITSLDQIEGKTVGIFTPAGTGVVMLDAILDKYDLTREDLGGVVTVGTGAPAVHALESGQIDIYFGYHGAYDNIEATAGLELRRLQDDPLITDTAFVAPSIWTRTDIVENHPDLVTRFLRGVSMGFAFAEEDPEAAVNAHFVLYPQTKPQGPDEEAIQQSVSALKSNLSVTSKPFGSVQPGSVVKTVEMLKTAGVITADVSPELLYTDQFIEQANEIDMSVVKKALE